jgi:hypothetical protein
LDRSFGRILLDQAYSLPCAIFRADFFSERGGSLLHAGVRGCLLNRGSEVIGGELALRDRRRASAESGDALPPEWL